MLAPGSHCTTRNCKHNTTNIKQTFPTVAQHLLQCYHTMYLIRNERSRCGKVVGGVREHNQHLLEQADRRYLWEVHENFMIFSSTSSSNETTLTYVRFSVYLHGCGIYYEAWYTINLCLNPNADNVWMWSMCESLQLVL